MSKIHGPVAKGCAILTAIVVGVPLLVVSVVGIRTWLPLRGAGEALDELERTLGSQATYVPSPSGAIPAERMELFLELRASLVTACEQYGGVRKGFDAVASLDSQEPGDIGDVGEAASGLGGAALAITPFLARFFESRNDALLAVSMGLEEYAYIYAVAYHDTLLCGPTRREIFSDGQALSAEAAHSLREALARQQASLPPGDDETLRQALAWELQKIEDDPSRLIWQDGLPDAIETSVEPYREQLDRLFCAATAGLELERDARRALRVALE